MELNSNPIGTVQFISIFSYLNSLSDFLFIENYLTEIDQSRQIPVVNALYEYLEDHHNNQTMKLKLIRYLLKGSDLYGENENENVDINFVNSMFDYIIKSLVFDKYGNIYGFLADVLRKTRRLQLNYFYKKIKDKLRNATFENEYARSSKLSLLAVNRIFQDIILPMFPQPKTDLNLLCLDYIYAQAGLNFLQPDRNNTKYYSDLKSNSTILDEENLFDEYLVTGFIIGNNRYNEYTSLATFQAFALPALFYYVFTEPVFYENITNIVHDPLYWKAAYEKLFSHLDSIFDKIENKFKRDSKYQMHSMLSKFYNHSELDVFFLDVKVQSFGNEEKGSTLSEYIDRPEYLQCKRSHHLQNPTEWFLLHVNNVTDTFEKHDLQSMQQSFGKSLIKSLKYDKIVVNLLAPDDNVVLGNFDNVTRLPYDLFEFYFPENRSAEYYALMRENYTTKLIKIADDQEDFWKKIGISIKTLLSHRYHRIIVKLGNQTVEDFWREFTMFKKLRLESYLKFSDTKLSLGEWWKEFGLTLMPFYLCTAETPQIAIYKGKVGKIDKIEFLANLDEFISSFITQSDTRSLLTNFGTTVKTIFLKKLIAQAVDSAFQLTEKDIFSTKEMYNTSEVFEKLALHIGDPGFYHDSLSKYDLKLLHVIIYVLQSKVLYPFPNIVHFLDNINILKSSATRKINIVGKEAERELYIESQNSITNTGYGYKFIYLGPNKTAQLRTDYEEKSKIFVHLTHIESDGEKMYSIVPNDTFVEGRRYIFEINNHLRRSVKTDAFFRISMHSYYWKNCNMELYIQRHIPLVECPRHDRAMKKKRFLNEAVEVALSQNPKLSEEKIMETMQKFTFPDEIRVDLHFVNDWLNNSNLEIPDWAEQYIIENSALLSRLRYDFHLDDPNLSNNDSVIRINFIYALRERKEIEGRTSLENIIKNYNAQNARFAVTFEDYYAIRNFAMSGYTRITGSTYEANFMKMALYKLAIRQSDDPDEEFDLTLFSVESIPIEIVNRTLSLRKVHVLQKFSRFYTSAMSAINSAAVALSGYKHILYEVKFNRPYFRAKIGQFRLFNETISILLPGTEFFIVNVLETQLFELGDYLKVELVYNHKSNEKYEWYKSIMKEITRLSLINE